MTGLSRTFGFLCCFLCVILISFFYFICRNNFLVVVVMQYVFLSTFRIVYVHKLSVSPPQFFDRAIFITNFC